MMKFSRDDEREADLTALRYMNRAGYDPRGMVEFLRVLRAQQGRDPGSVDLLRISSGTGRAHSPSRTAGQSPEIA